MDSGCELSLAPSNLVGKRQLRPSRHHVNAANGSPIGILGETDIEFSVSGRMSIATVLVTPDVSELMFGITWLTEQSFVWDFANRTLCINGVSVPLHTKKTAAMCRRVYVQENVVLAPRQQVDVPARSTVDNILYLRVMTDSWRRNNYVLAYWWHALCYLIDTVVLLFD